MDPIVTTDWLAGAGPDVRIVDATWFLPGADRDAAAEYRERHIPGAVFLGLDAMNGADGDLAGGTAFGDTLGALGIADGDTIVVYDDSPVHSAARAWWALRTMGARQTFVLDGGLAKWRAEGRPLASGTETLPPARFRVLGDASRRLGYDEMRSAVAHRDQIVDARSPARFRGEEPEPRAGVTPGHIPGAINLHYARLFADDGTYLSRDALARLFDAAGVEIDHPVVATCGSGVTAAVIVVALCRLGQDAALYDGSWADWGSRLDTPKATGA